MSGILLSFAGASYDAVRLVKSATFTNASGSISTTLSQTGMQSGDFVVLILSQNTEEENNSDFSLGGDLTWSDSGNSIFPDRGHIFWSQWNGTGSDPLSITATASRSQDWNAVAGVIGVFRGVSSQDRARPAGPGVSGMPNPPSQFVAANGGKLLVCGGAITASVTMTAPSGMTLVDSASNTNGGRSSSAALAYLVNMPNDYDPAEFGGGASSTWTAWSLLFDEDV